MKFTALLLCLSALLLPAAAEPAPPSLHVDPAAVDLGEARAGTLLTHTFTLTNTGESLLRIHNIRTSCGCTASHISTRELPAGATATLTASLNLAGRSGPQSETIRIQSNDPANPNLTLTLNATAIPRVSVTPRTLNFQNISPDTPPTAPIEILSTTDTPLTITEILTANNRVHTRLLEITPGKAYRLEITPIPGERSGHASERLEIRTDDPELPAIPVLVMWQVAEPVSVAPRRISLIADTPPKPMTRFLLIRGAADLDPPLEITGVSWPGRDIQFRIGTPGPFGTRVEFDVTPDPSMHAEHILIQTNVPGFTDLRLPVHVTSP